MSTFVSESLPDALQSDEIALVHLRYSFLAGFGIFVILFPFCSSRKSFFDAIAARKIIRNLRLFIVIEFALLGLLFFYFFTKGSPLELHAYLAYGDGDSWLYGFGRPSGGFLMIGFGLLGDMHPFCRILCCIGCCAQILGDGLSAFQVRDYYWQVMNFGAPTNGYSPTSLLIYYWRDVISFGTCVTLFMFALYLSVVVGCCPPQLIHPALISGQDYDRFSVMSALREKRRNMGIMGILGPRKVKKNKQKNTMKSLEEQQEGQGVEEVIEPEGGAGSQEDDLDLYNQRDQENQLFPLNEDSGQTPKSTPGKFFNKNGTFKGF